MLDDIPLPPPMSSRAPTPPLNIASHAGSEAAAMDRSNDHADAIELLPPPSTRTEPLPARPPPDPALVAAAEQRRQRTKRNERRIIIAAGVTFSAIVMGVGIAAGYTVTNPNYDGILAGALIAAVPVVSGWAVGTTYFMVVKPALQERRQRALARPSAQSHV